jgi:hypothetical protein
MVLTVHGLANGRATRLDTRDKRSFGLRWLLPITFFLGPAEQAAVEEKIADLALALGGRGGQRQPRSAASRLTCS